MSRVVNRGTIEDVKRAQYEDKAAWLDDLLKKLAPTLLEGMVKEHKFHPDRKWRFDRAWPAKVGGIAVEVDGGVHAGGRHTRGRGFEADLEKLNAAVLLGWTVFRFTPQMIQERPGYVLATLGATDEVHSAEEGRDVQSASSSRTRRSTPTCRR